MRGGAGGDDDGPPILVLTLASNPRGPTNDWSCHLGPDEGRDLLDGPWGGCVSTLEVGSVLASIAGRGYRLQSSLSFGLSSITGHENELVNMATRRSAAYPEKGCAMVRSTTAHCNVIQYVFQLMDNRDRFDEVEAQLQALKVRVDTEAQLLQREAAEGRAERTRLEEELTAVRASLDHERRERAEALAEKEGELAVLRRNVMEMAEALAAALAAQHSEEHVMMLSAATREREHAVPALEDAPPGMHFIDGAHADRYVASTDVNSARGAHAPRSLAPLALPPPVPTPPLGLPAPPLALPAPAEPAPAEAITAARQQQAELAEALAVPGEVRPVHEGGSGGTVVESEMPMEAFWRDIDNVLSEPLPHCVYDTPTRRHLASAENSFFASSGGLMKAFTCFGSETEVDEPFHCPRG